MLPEYGLLEVWPHKEPCPYKVLPFDIYDCDEQELNTRFVAAFPNSNTRSDIFQGFIRLRHEASSTGISAIQWVNGSFVSSKVDPDDIDVVSFVDYDELNKCSHVHGTLINDLLNGGENTKPQYRTHTFLVLACASNHPYFQVYEHWRTYWLEKWGKTYEDKNTGIKEPKGFLKMSIGTGPNPQIAK